MKFNIFLCALILHGATLPHGFSKNTFVCMQDKSFMTIEHLAYSIDIRKHYVESYDTPINQFVHNRVKAAHKNLTNNYCIISFSQEDAHDILCSLTQPFYRISDHTWIAAYNLSPRDILLCGDKASC